MTLYKKFQIFWARIYWELGIWSLVIIWNLGFGY